MTKSVIVEEEAREGGDSMTVVRVAVVQAAPVAFDREATLEKVQRPGRRGGGTVGRG